MPLMMNTRPLLAACALVALAALSACSDAHSASNEEDAFGTITLQTDDSMPDKCHFAASSAKYIGDKDGKLQPCEVRNVKYFHMNSVPSAVTVEFRGYKGSGPGECEENQIVFYSIVFKTRGSYTTTAAQGLSIQHMLQTAEKGKAIDNNFQVVKVDKDRSIGLTNDYLSQLGCIIVRDSN